MVCRNDGKRDGKRLVLEAEGLGHEFDGDWELAQEFSIGFYPYRCVSERARGEMTAPVCCDAIERGVRSVVEAMGVAEEGEGRDILEDCDIEDAIINHSIWSNPDACAKCVSVRDGNESNRRRVEWSAVEGHLDGERAVCRQGPKNGAYVTEGRGGQMKAGLIDGADHAAA